MRRAVTCLACTKHSRGYLRHLFIAGEMLGPTLMSLHNLTYYQKAHAGGPRSDRNRYTEQSLLQRKKASVGNFVSRSSRSFARTLPKVFWRPSNGRLWKRSPSAKSKDTAGKKATWTSTRKRSSRKRSCRKSKSQCGSTNHATKKH